MELAENGCLSHRKTTGMIIYRSFFSVKQIVKDRETLEFAVENYLA